MNKNVFREAVANIKMSKQTKEKLARIKERIKEMGDRTSELRKMIKEE